MSSFLFFIILIFDFISKKSNESDIYFLKSSSPQWVCYWAGGECETKWLYVTPLMPLSNNSILLYLEFYFFISFLTSLKHVKVHTFWQYHINICSLFSYSLFSLLSSQNKVRHVLYGCTNTLYSRFSAHVHTFSSFTWTSFLKQWQFELKLCVSVLYSAIQHLLQCDENLILDPAGLKSVSHFFKILIKLI